MNRPPMLAWLLLGTALSALAACDRTTAANAENPMKPVVLPAELEKVKVEPPALQRVDTAQIVLRDPRPLAAIQQDLFLQSDGVVDILWVIDDSGSMANERVKLADHFTRFMSTLLGEKVRFQIGVVTTSVELDAGRLQGNPKIIDNLTPNPLATFRANTTFPPSRGRWERGLEAARQALSEPNLSGPNAGFLRPGAALAVVAVSDEDDGSFGGTAYFARFLRSVKGQGNEDLVSFSVIAGTLPNGCDPPGEETFFGSRAEAAFRYVDVARRTGGVVGSICDQSFENTLEQIALALSTLHRGFALTLAPDELTIVVRVNGVLVPADPLHGWVYRKEIQSLTFPGDYVPPPGALVEITYVIK